MRVKGFGSKGFTLLEMVLVIGIIAVLAAIFIPVGLNALREADLAKANGDIQELATAVGQFFTDLRYMPACDGADCDPRIGTGGGDNNNLKFLAVIEGSGDPSTKYPPTGGLTWNFGANDETDPKVNNAFNHLVVNDPGANGTVGEVGVDYNTSGNRAWKGPYIARLNTDPWGNAYVISIGAMEADGSPIVSNAKGWILSAGPNGTLETAPDATSLTGDDIGMIFYTK